MRAAHDYKGRIDAALRIDDAAALFHLERAIDLDPTRIDALDDDRGAAARSRRRPPARERVQARAVPAARQGRRGGGRGLRAPRDALRRAPRRSGERAGRDHSAKKLVPRDPDVAVLAERIERLGANREPIRAGWRDALGDPEAGAALVSTAAAAGHADAAFLAASTMVALGTADDPMAAVYEQHRVTRP